MNEVLSAAQGKAVVAYLQTPQAIRDRCQQLFDDCQAGNLDHFSCDLDQLDPVAAYVVETLQQRYPTRQIPFHSRWRHFDAGGQSRLAALDQAFAQLPGDAATRARLDLAIMSVLLDAGAGSQWQFQDAKTGTRLGRSEGLAVASLRAFEQGLFSSDPDFPYRVDAIGLQQLTEADLRQLFQLTDENPMLGVPGRLTLLHRLGKTLSQQPGRFGTDPARPGNLLDTWKRQAPEGINAAHLLTSVLESFSAIWPGRITVAGMPLGDVWPHPALPTQTPGGSLIPFHKLSQWLTYSLVEPLTAAGLPVTQLDSLTGLAEYRNGGLCLDLQLLQPKDPAILAQTHAVGSPVVVEWRALTIILLDLISDRVRTRMHQSVADLPLIKVLEGGTWAAGRRIAKTLRSTGTPPLLIESDGTVF